MRLFTDKELGLKVGILVPMALKVSLWCQKRPLMMLRSSQMPSLQSARHWSHLGLLLWLLRKRGKKVVSGMEKEDVAVAMELVE